MMFLFYRTLELGLVLAALLSLLCSGFYLFLSYKIVFRPLLARAASNFVLLIASFGLLIATASALGMIFGSQSTLLARHLSDIRTINILGATLTTVQITNMALSLLLIFIFAFVIYKTHFGQVVRAVEDDNEVAELIGIPKDKIFSKLFFLSGVLGGLAGIIEGFDVGIIPSSGLLNMLSVIVISVLGGMKSFWGGIVGAFVLVAAQKLTVLYIGGSSEQAVPFVVLILVLLFRPEGIFKK